MATPSDKQPDLPAIGVTDLEVGDALLFRGTDKVSILAQKVLGSTFDHAGLIVGTEPTGQGGRGIEVIDILFKGSKTFDLADYEFRPDSLLVRRHRIPGNKGAIAARGRAMANPPMGYSDAKMLDVMLAALVRSSGALKELSSLEAYHFVCNLSSTFKTAANQLDQAAIGICVDAVASPFDTIVGGSVDAPYYGIVAPHFPAGLLSWVASGCDLSQWVQRVAAMGDPIADRRRGPIPVPPSPGFRDELYALRLSLNLSSQPLVDTYDEQETRRHVVTAAIRLAERIGVEVFDQITVEEVPDMTDEFVSTLAWWLLDGFLRHGVPLGPEQLERTSSLFDVGILNLDGVTWTEPSRRR